MEESFPLTTIGIVVLVAFGLGVVLRRLGQNPVIGYILAGIALGPLGAGFLSPGSGLTHSFGEIGLFVLLFYLGLELSLKKFIATGSTATVLALVDMVALTGGGALAMYLLGYSGLFSITVGIMLFCTSTAVVAKFILDNKLFENSGARLSLAILIMQDFLALLLLVFLAGVSASGSAWSVGLTAVVFVVAAFSAIRHLSIKVEAWLAQNNIGHSETTLYALGIGLLAAIVGQLFGISAGLGAYFAGFALSETRAGDRIKSDLGFMREFFLLFFFVAFGTTLFYDAAAGKSALPGIESLLLTAGLTVLLVCIIYAANFIAFATAGLKLGLSHENASLGALLLTPIGEFAVIVATSVALVLPPAEGQLILQVAFFLILASVLSFQPAYSLRHHHSRLMSMMPNAAVGEQTKLAPHSIDTLRHAKRFAINAFIVTCIGAISLFIYDSAPAFNIPVPYSRALITLAVFAFFAALPAGKALSSLRMLASQVALVVSKAGRPKKRGRKGRNHAR